MLVPSSGSSSHRLGFTAIFRKLLNALKLLLKGLLLGIIKSLKAKSFTGSPRNAVVNWPVWKWNRGSTSHSILNRESRKPSLFKSFCHQQVSLPVYKLSRKEKVRRKSPRSGLRKKATVDWSQRLRKGPSKSSQIRIILEDIDWQKPIVREMKESKGFEESSHDGIEIEIKGKRRDQNRCASCRDLNITWRCERHKKRSSRSGHLTRSSVVGWTRKRIRTWK